MNIQGAFIWTCKLQIIHDPPKIEDDCVCFSRLITRLCSYFLEEYIMNHIGMSHGQNFSMSLMTMEVWFHG